MALVASRWPLGRSTAALVALVATGALATSAEAAPKREQCVAAYEETQIAMRRSRLLDARQPLQTCLDQACPTMLRTDCATWLKEVEARIPSVVVELVAEDVNAKAAQLFVDGKLWEPGIDGKAMELDPGNHSFRVDVDGRSASVDVFAREGEKLKVVRVEIPSKAGSQPTPKPPNVVPDQPQRPQSRPVPWTVVAAGALGLAAAGVFTGFAVVGMSGKGDLEPCKPDCSAAQIDSVRTKFIIADVSLGVSVVALAAATYLFIARPSVPSRVGLTRRPEASLVGGFAF